MQNQNQEDKEGVEIFGCQNQIYRGHNQWSIEDYNNEQNIEDSLEENEYPLHENAYDYLIKMPIHNDSTKEARVGERVKRQTFDADQY